MPSVTRRKTGKYKNAFILMPKEVGSLVASVVSGCVVLDTAVELLTTSTVDEGSVSIGKRFILQSSSVQHSATQRAKYTGPERLPFLWLQADVVQLPADAGKQPRMPINVPFVNSAVNAMHLNKNEMINTSQSNVTLRTSKFIYMYSRDLRQRAAILRTHQEHPREGKYTSTKCRA